MAHGLVMNRRKGARDVGSKCGMFDERLQSLLWMTPIKIPSQINRSTIDNEVPPSTHLNTAHSSVGTTIGA